MDTLAQRVRYCLGFPNKSQAELAKACGIKQPSISDWLNGRTKRITGKNLLRAATYFGVNAEWLATGRGPIKANDPPLSASEPIPMPYVHPHPLVRQVIALMEATDEAGKGMVFMAASQALEKYRPKQETAA